jgi:hypothetical protein
MSKTNLREVELIYGIIAATTVLLTIVLLLLLF